MKAVYRGQTIAESDNTEVVEGNHYFPSDSVDSKYLSSSELQTVCHWKGTASYFNVVVDGETSNDAAWYYPEPSAAANNIKGYIAFWKDVEIIE